MKSLCLIAAASMPAAFAQWGSVALPPEESCGNHSNYVDEPQSFYEMLMEAYEIQMLQQYGVARSQCELAWDNLDHCDMEIRKQQKMRVGEAEKVTSFEANEAALNALF